MRKCFTCILAGTLAIGSMPAIADSGFSPTFKSVMEIDGSQAKRIGVASCRAKGGKLYIYPIDRYHPDVVQNSFIWTSDTVTIQLMSSVCLQGGNFNFSTPDGVHWEMWIGPNWPL